MMFDEVMGLGVSGCVEVVVVALMVSKRVSADDHSLCSFIRSLPSLKIFFQSSLKASAILVVPSSMLTKVSTSQEGAGSVVFF